ncbi:MAG: hypothetical protein A2Y17_11185 [Clostridiales bacterium GWF2_38_85]|nr:MAG: hypothetical protein A2Y17_11185 [Clostridiales bacterium GWF2_38_85]HBL84689.1 hypothetical protein [Clostridiales bacterium]
MFNLLKKGITKDLSWFTKRYNALLIDFPNEITPNILKSDDICIGYDSKDVYEALKIAHIFLKSIAGEMLFIPERDEDKIVLISKTFSKIDLLWALGFYGELCQDANEYCIAFKKPLITNVQTIPKNYSESFTNISENDCWIEYLKGNKEVKDYKSCDNGILHFDNNLIALGIYIFVKKCAQKRWYWEVDRAGGYTQKTQFNPIKHCVEPYHRIDMRVFICGERLKFDIMEELAGYNEDLKRYFKKIYDFVQGNYPDCLPDNGIYGYINCSVTFGVDSDHRMIGQIGVGHNENKFGFYGALTNKEMDTMISDIDSFGEKVVMQFLHDTSCSCDLCKNKIGKIVYRGKKYNRVYKNTENRFSIENEDDVDLAIKCIDIKAKCNMNTRI